ncbi:hypothetical protein TNCV_4795161 [Trichonephila clavipes]|nr:hypothetical protein TNCV_4795161 [Trichonephila clavipes]
MRVLSDLSFHHFPHIFYGVQIRALQWPGKMLEVRLMFSEPILNTSGMTYSYTMAHEVFVTIRVKRQHCRVHLMSQWRNVHHRIVKGPKPGFAGGLNVLRNSTALSVYLGISWLFVYPSRNTSMPAERAP